jgi:formylglycine-generating enzyme required for sulfatase activity
MKKTFQAAVFTLFAASTAQAQDAVQWRVEDGGNGHWYAQISYGGGRTYTEAKLLCESRGGHLATIASAGEQQVICNVLTVLTGWIGAERSKLGWGWCTGEPWTFGAICSPTPNADRIQLYGCTCWNDTFDGDTLTDSAIIEWSADCNGDGIVDYGQILQGQLVDSDRNGVPDVCEVDPCPADITGNGLVNGADLGLVLAAWGSDGSEQPGADTNADGIVNGADLATVIGAFGPCPTVPSWATLIEAQPDPAVVWDADLRAAIRATGLAWRVRDTATQIEMLLIPPGSFEMGCSASWSYSCVFNESPVHTVTLTNAFYLGRYEVTQSQWQARMGSNPSYFQSPSSDVPSDQVPNRPVEQVSWNMIAGAGGFMTQTGMRLPTEAEWEYAYRAGTTTAFHGFTGYPRGTDEDWLAGNIAWLGTFFGGNSNGQSHPVGVKLGNGFGLHDMAGNVWEWVNDWYSSSYYASSPLENPPGPASGLYRVIRGGSWGNDADYPRASSRPIGNTLDVTNPALGFRAARNP